MEHLCDCHTHTWYSFDAQCTVEELCRAAHAYGLSAVAMTEHFDYDGGTGGDYYEARVSRRMAELSRARARWEGRLEILCGIELGQPHLEPEAARRLADSDGLDLVIGSLHELRPHRDIYRDLVLDTPEACDAAYRDFFQEARELVRLCDVDVFGHYDYPLRLMSKAGVAPNMERWQELMLPFLKDLAQSGIALELNTTGLRRWMGRPAGEPWLLERFRAFGGRRVTIGSDAHHSAHVGLGVRETCALLRECGFDSVTVYRRRRPVQLSI